MHITVTIKNVYGNETVYPADDTARLFCELTSRKTLTPHDMHVIRKLGYDVEVGETPAVRPEWIYGS